MEEIFKSVELCRKNGGSVTVEHELKDKYVGVLFGAAWCPPCRNFTPMLKKFYEVAKKDFEVVFVSRDHAENSMMAYLKEHHGNWLYAKFRDKHAHHLLKKFCTAGIPTLTVLKPDGTVLLKDAVKEVVDGKENPQQTIDNWKKK
ncbi:unnamed protein product [Bursaphelenchus okinawaensis]|uniref:Thioredoxin domain-containing protein n=1 Tax=Bursaphelenchus okinawaensis TaxID=465554 RepID=A0A811KYY3_9BILA|nr:unnamed protein product [Bursaphelenchus okinawaensis]CAG9114007.1 unnamed protein product [Bursaphelenchus okinawaensis]